MKNHCGDGPASADAFRTIPTTQVSRRTFLRGSAAAAIAAGAAGLVGCAPEAQKPADAEKPADESVEADAEPKGQTLTYDIAPVKEDVYPGTCLGFCNGACSLNLHVRDGKLRRVSKRDLDGQHDRICQKGYTHPYRMYNPNRLTAPLRRVGERGEGKWEEISWDEAIAEIAEKWKAITDQFGPGAMFVAGLTGNQSGVGGMRGSSIYQRFQTALGMSSIDNDVDAATNFALGRMIGSGQFSTANAPRDLANAKTIFIWGANPAVSQVHSMHFITEAQQKGAKVVVIDPVFNANAAIADQYVPVRSATDGALALGMLSAILENGWEDVDFITNHTVAPFLVNPESHKFLRLSDLGKAEAGTEEDVPVVTDGNGAFDVPSAIAAPQIEGTAIYDGVEYTTAYTLLLGRIAEWPVARASEVTGVSEDDIVELARRYSQDAPSAILTVFGCDHYTNGHWSYSCMGALPLLTGNVGKPGTGIGTYSGGGSPAFDTSWVTDVPCPVEKRKTYHVLRLHELFVNHSYNGEPVEARGLYCAFADMVSNVADRNKTIEAMKSLDLLVVSDIVMSETAELADYVLPASYWFECEGIMNGGRSNPYVSYQSAALPPLGDSKPDFEIFKLLAEALGVGEHFQFTEEEWIRRLCDNEKAQKLGITYEAFRDNGYCRMLDTESEPFVNAKDGNFSTPTGRGEFYIEDPKPSNDYAPAFDFDKERLPYWEETLEVGEHSEIRKTYPLQLLSEHSRFRTHTQWWEVQALLEVDSNQFVYINPDDAQTYGIADGDKVRIFNDRGELVTLARVRPNNPPGVLSAPKGWRADQVGGGHLSNLDTTQSNGFCANQPFNDCVVAIEKA